MNESVRSNADKNQEKANDKFDVLTQNLSNLNADQKSCASEKTHSINLIMKKAYRKSGRRWKRKNKGGLNGTSRQ